MNKLALASLGLTVIVLAACSSDSATGTKSATTLESVAGISTGRAILTGTLRGGGTAYFAARSDLSTLLHDMALVRPTQLSFVPRIWEILFQDYQSRLEHHAEDQAPNRAEHRVCEHQPHHLKQLFVRCRERLYHLQRLLPARRAVSGGDRFRHSGRTMDAR